MEVAMGEVAAAVREAEARVVAAARRGMEGVVEKARVDWAREVAANTVVVATALDEWARVAAVATAPASLAWVRTEEGGEMETEARRMEVAVERARVTEAKGAEAVAIQTAVVVTAPDEWARVAAVATAPEKGEEMETEAGVSTMQARVAERRTVAA